MSKFDDIMLHLNPRVIIEKTETPHDIARGNCTLQNSIVRNYAEFENIVIAYVSHHMEQIFGAAPPPEFCLDKGRKFLEVSTGFDNCVFIGLSGTEGGMYHVLDLICDGFKNEAKQAYFTYIIDNFIDPLSFQEVVELMRELKQRLGHYSPQSFSYVQAESMAAHYKQVLWSYIESLTRYRNLWTY